MVIILGIESTAHTFGVGIVRDGNVLSNVRKCYVVDKGGIIPMEAAKHHREHKEEVYLDSLDEAGISEDEVDAIAVSRGPGLAPCLIEGMKFAKEISKKLNVPIVPVNHCVAHLEIGGSLKNGPKDPVMLYASGANTQVIAYESGKFRVFGETLDIGVGNFIDNFARYSGIGFPGGPKIEKLAKGVNRRSLIEIPYSVKGMDVALSGVLTNLRQKLESGKYSVSDLAYSMQETVFAMLVEVSERALAHTGKKELLLGGGVACNSRLQEMCETMCKERGAKFFCPEKSLLVDNGSMIAFLGEVMFNKGIKVPCDSINELDIAPRQRTDDIEVKWR